MKYLIINILLILSISLCAESLPAADEFQQRLSESLVAVQTIQSDFTQIREMPALEMKLEISGHLAFDSTAKRLLWRVEKPLPCAFRMQGGKLSQWDGETGKVLSISATKLPWLKLLQERLGQWLSGDLPALRREAEVTVLAATRVRLTPIGGMLETIAKAVEIEFSEDLTHVVHIRIEEKTGDVLSIHFRNAILNQPIPEELWELK